MTKHKIKRLVADKNVLGQGKALAWLARSSKHQLVITDFFLIECMQGNSIINLSSDFAPLAPFANQLVLLKATSLMIGERPRSMGLQSRWISHPLTIHFRERLVRGGDRFAQEMLNDPAFVEFSKRSKSFLNSISANADEYRKTLADIIHKWPIPMLGSFRSSGQLSYKFAEEIFGTVRDTAARLFHDWPRALIPPFANAIHSFEYRYALACIFLAVEWSKGGLQKVAAEKLRNDLVDMTYVAFATMFDGLMTDEKKVNRIYANARFMVEVAKLVVEHEQRSNRI